MENATNNYGMTKKDMLNAMTSSIALQEKKGETVTIRAAAVTTGADEKTGEVKSVGYMVTDDNTVLGTISPTAIRAIEGLIEILNDENGTSQNVKITERKSKGGRDFITLTII